MKTLLFISVLAFSVMAHADSFHKNSHALRALTSAWKNYQSLTPKLHSNDITMGYAGEDVYHRIFVTPHRFAG